MSAENTLIKQDKPPKISQKLTYGSTNFIQHVWSELAIGSWTVLRSARILHHVKQVLCVEGQDDRIFLASLPL